MIAVPAPLNIEEWQEQSAIYHRYRIATSLPLVYIGTNAPPGLVPGYDGGLALMMTDTLRRLRKVLDGQ